MKRKQVKYEVGSWPQVIEFTEGKLELSRRKTAELEDMLALFRRLESTGQPSPADLAHGRAARKQSKSAQM